MEDYKEKYEMALEGVQEILSSGQDSIKMSQLALRLHGIFPELKESEDEEIRKEIIAFIKKRDRSGCDYDYDKWIAWIEKQGKQKPTSNIRYEVGANGSLSVNVKPFDYEKATITQKDFASVNYTGEENKLEWTTEDEHVFGQIKSVIKKADNLGALEKVEALNLLKTLRYNNKLPLDIDAMVEKYRNGYSLEEALGKDFIEISSKAYCQGILDTLKKMEGE